MTIDKQEGKSVQTAVSTEATGSDLKQWTTATVVIESSKPLTRV